MTLLHERWRLDGAKTAGCPSVAPSVDDAGSVPLIVVGTTDGRVVAYDGKGDERWSVFIGGVVSAWPVVENVPGLGPCILVANEQGAVVCLSPEGKAYWRTDLESSVTSFNSLGVVRGEGEAFLVVTDRQGRATGLDRQGKVLWTFHTYHGGLGPAAIGDLDDDGRDEILFCSGDGNLYCLDHDGSLIWWVTFQGGAEYSGPVLADFGSGPRVLVGAGDDLLRCVGPDGRVLWTQRGAGAGSIEIDLALADINGDGRDEVVYCHAGRAIQAVNGNGEPLWAAFYGGGDQPFGPSIGDINEDGKPEILLSQRDGPTMRVLDHKGDLLEEHPVPGGMVGAPVIADIDLDGRLEVLVVEHRTGALVCYQTPSRASPGAVPWPTSRGGFDGRSNHLLPRTKRASSPSPPEPSEIPRITPIWRAGPGLGKNDVAFVAEGEIDPDRYRVAVIFRGPDGVEHRAAVAPGDGAIFEVLIPGRYDLEARLIDRSTGGSGAHYHESLDIDLFGRERSEAAKFLGALERIGEEIEGLGPIVRHHRIAWRDIEERARNYATLPKRGKREMVSEVHGALGALKRDLTLNKLRGSVMRQRGTPVEFLAWLPEHPWVKFDERTDACDKVLEEMEIHTDVGGHDAFVVQVGNLRSKALVLRVWLDPLLSETGETHPAFDHLTLRQVTWVPTSSGTMAPDALPEIGNAGLLHLPAQGSGRLWVDVDAGSLPPGKYSTVLHMRGLVPKEAVWQFSIRWTVAPIELPDPIPLRFCNWGYFLDSPLKETPESALKDMQDHHTNVFVLSGELLPRVYYDREGELVGEIEWRKLDWILERLRPGDMFLVPGGLVVPLEGAPGQGSEEWEKAFQTFLPIWAEHLKERGIGYDQWAFYPVDEPGLLGGALIDRLERYARFYKELDPHVRVYTDPFKGMTVSDLKRVMEVVDIFQPNFGAVVKEPSHERIDFLTSTTREIWTYEAAGGVKEMVGVGYYWEQIWSAWELGLSGVGFWSYCTRPYDLWQGPNPNNNDWEMVYQGRNGPVPSVRWQGIRIGIEDYARLWRLRESIRVARESGFRDRAEEADKRLRAIVEEAREGLWDPALISKLRREMIDAAVALKGLVA